MLTVLSSPNSYDLATVIQAEAELGVTDSNNVLARMITQASELVYEILGYPAYRTEYRETLQSRGEDRLVLQARPIRSIDAASFNGDAIDETEIVIVDANLGWVERESGFSTVYSLAEWSIDTTAGWFLPGDDVSASISAASADNSYNSSAAAFPLYVVAGDFLAASGFTNAANNGLKRILTATASKIVVQETLVTETAGTRALAFKNVPASLERACMDTVRTWWGERLHASGIASKSVDDVSITYHNPQSVQALRRHLRAGLNAWVTW